MTKSDLRSGMVVEMRCGDKCMVVKDVNTTIYGRQDIVFIGNNIFYVGSKYTDNLKNCCNDDDIIKVYAIKQADSEVFQHILSENEIMCSSYLELIWERKELPDFKHDEVIEVKDFESEGWHKRYFKEFDRERERVICYSGGRSSLTMLGEDDIISWKYFRKLGESK